MLAVIGKKFSAALAKLGLFVLAAWFLVRHGKNEARRKMAEKSLERAKDANAFDERVAGMPDDELDRMFRDSQR